MSKIPLRHRLWTRLLVSHTLLAVLPLLTVGLILIRTSRHAIEEMVWNSNLELARRAAAEIQLYQEQPMTIIQHTAQILSTAAMTSFDQEKVLERLAYRDETLKEISILNRQGQELRSTRLSQERGNQIRGLLDPVQLEQAYFSPVTIDPQDQLPTMTISAPLRRFNETYGVLAAKVNLKAMWDLVEQIKLDGALQNQTRQVYIVDRSGLLIAHPERSRVYEHEKLLHYPIIREVLAGHSGTMTYQSADGRMVAGYVPLERLGWGVVVEQPAADAFAASNKMGFEVVASILVSLAIATLIAVLLADRINRPVDQLVLGVQHFAQGDLGHRITVRGRGELALLAREFNQMANSLRQQRDKLRRAERAAILSRIAAMVSHELRNPLNSMVINLQVLKRLLIKQDRLTAQPLRYFDIIASEIERVNNLITEFLAYARPPALSPVLCNLNEILDEVVETNQALAQHKEITVNTQYQELMPVEVDRNQLKQVFLNLLLNAFDAMEQGGQLTVAGWWGPPPQEQAGAQESKDDWVYVAFRDTGCGIPEERMAHIFDFYYTSKANGTGLGLSIAQQIIDKHGGLLKVNSEVGEGTTVTIALPKKAQPSPVAGVTERMVLSGPG